MTTGLELVNKWIEKNREMGLPDEAMEGTKFVFGDMLYTIRKNGEGRFHVDSSQGKIVIFRDLKQYTDELTCRICGTEYDNKIDTIRCCTNGDE
ncbi:hypothetical protein [Effusibacillus lacus]|uniref:Uncharacterized protein n=1 Tax=Effusibacillus lacus TaxID=1348429 RepID=A0A292YKQ6_9BACL|nr:hypothetical protein [Effusibacillus lacus]TCS75112.1 hypothetical protein EDD64_10937 [Effusibacillus lacus]GAX89065.1 hypothetical protein EFBL_0679 [Effusibacillus lacus]